MAKQTWSACFLFDSSFFGREPHQGQEAGRTS